MGQNLCQILGVRGHTTAVEENQAKTLLPKPLFGNTRPGKTLKGSSNLGKKGGMLNRALVRRNEP